VEEALFATHRDLENRHWWFRGRRRAIVELGLRLMPPGGSVVDAGCGTGADIAAFPATYRRHGLDISATAIAFARENHPAVSFEVGAVPEAGGDAIGAADLVLLCDVLEHIEDHVAFLHGLVTLMKPGANLLLTVPADPRLWSPHDEVYGHFRRYTRSTLAAVWQDAPVRPRLLAPFNRRLYPVARAARAVSAWRGRGWGSEASDLALPWAPVNRLLERVFAGEAPALAGALDRGQTEVSGRGLSLLAVLERSAAPASMDSPAVVQSEMSGG
jgi:trans-aconitate methyltransferase